jgi:hypothetical protein
VKDNGFPWPPPGLLGIFFTSVTVCAKKRKKKQKRNNLHERRTWEFGRERVPLRSFHIVARDVAGSMSAMNWSVELPVLACIRRR